MNFRVGQKVVCVDDSPCWCGKAPALRQGDIYTVTFVSPKPDRHGSYGIRVAEAKSHDHTMNFNRGFRASRFRPAVERKTDISIFTRMLTPKKQSVHS